MIRRQHELKIESLKEKYPFKKIFNEMNILRLNLKLINKFIVNDIVSVF